MSDDLLYLRHIADAIARITAYISVGRDEFMHMPHWQDATIRQLEVIGEATKHLSTELRDKYPSVPWRRIAGMRDVLIHGYMGVDLSAVWDVTQTYIPELRSNIDAILSAVKEQNEPKE